MLEFFHCDLSLHAMDMRPSYAWDICSKPFGTHPYLLKHPHMTQLKSVGVGPVIQTFEALGLAGVSLRRGIFLMVNVNESGLGKVWLTSGSQA